jgi:hypothetical protein
MRSFAALIEKARMRDPGIPDSRLIRAQPGQLHRLDEGIAELFDHACITGDLVSATDLVVLMEKWLPLHTEGDDELRQATGVRLKRMRAELVRRYVGKGIRPPNNEAWLRGDSD